MRRLKCPICQKPVTRKEADFTFCSRRCRTIDLGRWASGEYVISTPITDAEPFGEGEDDGAGERDQEASEQRKKTG